VTDFLLSNEPHIRLIAFGGILAGMALWETVSPRRDFEIGWTRRWPANLGIVVLDTLLLRLAFPVTAVGLALVVEGKRWGLLPLLGLPSWTAIPLAVVLLDLTIYAQHRLFHAIPVLWRLHRMHHADVGFDVSTGIRFHPIEIVLSMAIKLGAIVLIGTPAVAVLIFEIVLNATSLFNHGNVRIPLRLDALLRWLVVTPDMHRVHHSARSEETNANFGFNLPWWDRLFGTYRDQPAFGHEAMVLGIEPFRGEGELRLDQMLVQPLRGADGRLPFSGRTKDA
jgi:sterol desaturase/sphingolipid hydroxylase (fatty acid hydroxylase superfamily)